MKPTACRKERSVLKKLVLCAPTHYNTFSTATVAIFDILSKTENKQKTTFNEARNG